LKIGVVTLFSEMFAALDYGIPRRAQEKGALQLECWDPRTYTTDVHRTVDDTPYGGGPGMVMKVAPLQAAITAARQSLPNATVIYLSPQGKTLDHATIKLLSETKELILLCGRYEGIDERLVALEVDCEYSIGDYVLSGGELPAMVLIDALSRQLPDVLGDNDSAIEDSFVDGLLDCPHYTRPAEIAGKAVPAVLLSGDHAAIKQWRLKQSLGRTWERRPDLLANRLKQKTLGKLEQSLLEDYKKDSGRS
jgi:tRNA (guanine37-N1)-methyltransferase